MKRKHLLLLVTLVIAMFVLSGCGVDRTGVDVTSVAPEGWWQVIVVWPLAKTLIWMNGVLSGLNIPYSWGFSIILFTLFIKLVTFPLTMTQLKGMQAQKELQPKIKELQKKYGKDREKISQEQMKLYQEAGVNPLSGCLPLVVQMPVLFGLYSALITLGGTLVDAHFFWIPDLGFPAYTLGLSWISEDFNAGNYGHLAAYLVLPALLMVSQFVMQKMTTQATPDPGDTQGNMMRQMSWMMSLMFGFFTLQVPAGLSLYWVTSNLLQLAQQWFVANRMNLSASPTPALAAGGAGGGTISAEVASVSSSTTSSTGTKKPSGSSGSSSKPTANTSKKRRKKRKRK